MPGDARFATESGGGLTNFTGLVHDAYFLEGEYGTSLNLKIALDNPELYPNVEGGETTLFLACGGGWVPIANGDQVVHTTQNPNKKYNASSELGVFAKRLFNEEIGNYEAFMADIPADFSLYKASSFKGLRFRFDEVEYESRKMGKDEAGNDTGVWVAGTKARRMPVEYLGKAGGAALNGSASVSFDLASLSLPDSLLADVAAAAASTETDSAFSAKLIGIPGVTGEAALMACLADAGQVAALKKALVDA